MTRTIVSCIVAVLLFAIGYSPAADSPAKPDIVFILADDLGFADVGFHGSEIKTPAIDKLAAGGVRLESFYVQPVCSPTRSCLMSGRYPFRTGLQVGVIRPWAQYGLGLEERMLPQALKEAGYTTAICGKWHLGSFDKAYWPNARGFDHWYGHLFGALDYFSHVRDGKHDWYRNGEPCKDEGYSTHLLAREAVKLVKDQPKDKPLFLYVPFNAVHAPHQVPDKYKEPYAQLKEPRRTYAGMLAAMDEAIGQIVGALEETGRKRNTLIIFSSDNGGPSPGKVTSNGKLRAGKGEVYEGGVRVAALANWEGRIKPGSACDEPIHMVDWYATLIKLAGGSLEQKLPIDGKDILPTLLEGKPSPHDYVVMNIAPKGGAIRMGDWKLVLGGDARDDEAADDGNIDAQPVAARRKAAAPAAQKVELFNLREDLSEKTNLADQQPEKLKELKQKYQELAKQAVEPKNSGKKK